MPVELRSDTFTKPSQQMRDAMARAEVGDDVWGEDPTAIALEAAASELLGKQAGLFVPTGSMGNEIAIHVHTSAGDEVICGPDSHIAEAELGAPAALSHVMLKPVAWSNGVFDNEAFVASLKAKSRYFTHTGLVCFENTHQAAAGAPADLEALREHSSIARDRGIPVHLDGARIFNAAIATNRSVKEIADCADSVMFCFSKGLGAPVGSMLLGDEEFIEQARRIRKMFGGGMRQVGVLCAAAAIALEQGPTRLTDDHRRAKRLAEGIAEVWDEEAVDPASVKTNIVYIRCGERKADQLEAQLADAGVRVAVMPGNQLRAVTHLDVDDDGIELAIKAFAQL